jgi:hypothetical protein
MLDGVFVPGPEGVPKFRALPRLKTYEVSARAKASFARQRPSRTAWNPSTCKTLVVQEMGFNLHAASITGAEAMVVGWRRAWRGRVGPGRGGLAQAL